MKRLLAFWDSSVGKKAVMAVTGLILVAFVIGHMIGNLQVFQGAARLDAYGALLHGPLNEITWAVRVVLFVSVILHIIAAVQLTQRNRAARPEGYAVREPQVSTFAARTLRWGGFLLLIFIIYHLLDLTIGPANPDFMSVAGALAESGTRILTVAPVFLARGGHVKQDLPRLAAEAGARWPMAVRLLPTLGESDPVLNAMAHWLQDQVRSD